MYLRKVYDPRADSYRVRYAIANILRDRVVNAGAFAVCFEMDDQVEVVRAILCRALKDPTLRMALERSHLVDLNQWLAQHIDLAEAYYNESEEKLRRSLASIETGGNSLVSADRTL